jgi:hypothetical protein
MSSEVLKKGQFTETGVMAQGDGSSTEYIDRSPELKIRRRWNHDGTVAHDDIITLEEFFEGTKDARTVRSDSGQLSGERQVGESSQEAGSDDVQRASGAGSGSGNGKVGQREEVEGP